MSPDEDVGSDSARVAVKSFQQLWIYRQAFEAAMTVMERSKSWPRDEQYALTGQIRRSSRSVCSNLAEAWQKRRYEAHFISKLSDADSEAAETRCWLEFAARCGYLDQAQYSTLDRTYGSIGAGLGKMMHDASTWCRSSSMREDPVDYDV